MPVDVTNPNSFEDLSEKALKEFGKISTWVNNAGGLPDGTPRYLTKTSFEEFEAQINLNFTAVFTGCVTAAKKMQEGGAIINISSSSSKMSSNSLYGSETSYFTSSGQLVFAADTDTYIHHPEDNEIAITVSGGSFPIARFGTGGNNGTVGLRTDTNLVTSGEILSVRGYSSFKSPTNVYAAIYTHNEGNTSNTYNAHLLWNAGAVSYTHLTLPTSDLV